MSDLRALRRRRDELCLADLLEEIIEVERLRDRVDAMGTENLLRFVELAHRFTPLDGEPDVWDLVDGDQTIGIGERERGLIVGVAAVDAELGPELEDLDVGDIPSIRHDQGA